MSHHTGRVLRPSSRLLVLTLVAGLASILPSRAAAQQPGALPDSVQRSMEAASLMMVPMFGRMAEIMVESTLKTLSKPENTDRLAAFMRQYYDALVKQGFSKAEALQIVVAAGLPTAPGAK